MNVNCLAIAKAVAEWQAKKESGALDLDKTREENIYLTREIKVIATTLVSWEVSVSSSVVLQDGSNLAESDEEMETEAPRFVAHVNVPSQKEVEEAILRRKKMELLEKYVSADLLAEMESTPSQTS